MNEELKKVPPDNNISMANDIANMLRKHGVTIDHTFTEPPNTERLEHIFTLAREMLRTY